MGVGVEAVIAHRDLALVRDMGGDPGDKKKPEKIATLLARRLLFEKPPQDLLGHLFGLVEVAHHEQRRDMVQEVGQAENSVDLFFRGEGQELYERSGDGQPVGGGVHLVLGKAEVAGPDIFLSEELDLLEPDDLGGDVGAVGDVAAGEPPLVEDVHE